jgi:thiosulfate reductase / polysulfide reductase chain A
MEIDSKKLRDLGLPSLPVYLPVPDHKDLKDGEFILTVNRPSILTQRLANAKWLAEILHNNPLWIHSETAQAKGFRDGDRVKVTSPAGSIRVRLRFSQGIHPQVLVLTQGLGHTALGKIAQAKQYKGNDFDTELLWWEEGGNGVNPNTIILSDLNPTTGGIAWNSTKVTLTKV